ncbi:MAG TPA: type III polyketide synthase, partial [Anaeromyxobacteraceae bacterium]|nr:type III polyketide synthase [Anaeromyxobacteraceae bacterium]
MAATPDPAILSIGRALPTNYVDQETLTAALSAAWAEQHYNAERLDQIHRATLVSGRHLALPIDEYAGLGGLRKRSDAWLRVALDVGE